jgi:hypothetical protein
MASIANRKPVFNLLRPLFGVPLHEMKLRNNSVATYNIFSDSMVADS